MFDREFLHFLAPGLKPKPAAKAHRTARPGTLGSLNREQFKALVDSSLSKAMHTGPDPKPAPGRTEIKARPFIQFKGIQSMESREALQLLLGMSAQERADVLAALDKIQKTATAWGMIPADLIELIKG